MQQLPDWNAVRFDRLAQRGHVESFFVKANDRDGQRALWIKATIFASSARPFHALAEAWAVVFERGGTHVAVKQTLPYAQAFFSTQQLDIRIGDLITLNRETCSGQLAHAGHRISWNLKLEGEASPVVPFAWTRMYEAPLPRSKLVSPMPDLRLSGQLTVDGQEIVVTNWRGMQGHNWGSAHAERYAWAHCNVWDQDADVLLEAVSAKLKVGPVTTPVVTLAVLRREGVQYSFTGPASLVQNRAELHRHRWFVRAKTAGAYMEADFSAPAADLVGLYYPNPDGAMTYCLNSKIAHARVRLELAGRRPLNLTTRSAAFELGTRDPDHGVEMYV